MWQLSDERLHCQGRSFSQPLVSETVEWIRAAFIWSPWSKSEKPELGYKLYEAPSVVSSKPYKVQLLQCISEDGRVRRVVVSDDLLVEWKKTVHLTCTYFQQRRHASSECICKETLCSEDSSLLRYYTMLTGKQLLTFWRGAVPSSSGLSTLALLELLDPEDGGTTVLRNVSNCLPAIWFIFVCLTLKMEFQQDLASYDSFCILLKTSIYSQFSFTETPFLVWCTWTCWSSDMSSFL
jgi:hypothetical protein